MKVENKVAAITGAGSGIGRALALSLAEKQCELALSDVDEAGLNETKQLIEDAYQSKVSTSLLDVRDKEAVYDWAEQVVKNHGAVHMIFNNAGVSLAGPVSDIPEDDYEWVMAINFWGVVYGTKAFLPKIEASGGGQIINISSLFGLTAQPFMSGYNASKFAVRGFTESLRQDLAYTKSNVSSTCVHPGGIKTNIAKSGRVADGTLKMMGADLSTTISQMEKNFLHTPETAAKTIIKAVEKNKRRVLIGAEAHFFDVAARIFPQGYQHLSTWLFKAQEKALKKGEKTAVQATKSST